MQITEADKLRRDLEQLMNAKEALEGVVESLGDNRRTTGLWLALTLTRTVEMINHQIGKKKQDIVNEEAEERIRKARKEAGDGQGQASGKKNADGDHPVDADLHGRAEADVQQKRERADAAGRHERQLGDVEHVRDLAAGEGAGRGRHTVTGSAEDCLRSRYRDRNREALRDWQREVMEAEREGRREMLIL